MQICTWRLGVSVQRCTATTFSSALARTISCGSCWARVAVTMRAFLDSCRLNFKLLFIDKFVNY